MAPILKGRRRKLTKYDHQFIEENTARYAAEARRRRNDDTQDHSLSGSVYHAHTSIDVTHRDRHSVKPSYFRAPQATPNPRVVLPVTLPEGVSEAFNFDVVDEAYVDYLVDTNIDAEPIKTKRKRTAGVSIFLTCLHVSCSLCSRMNPRSYGFPSAINFSRSSSDLKGAEKPHCIRHAKACLGA
jgi:hypothetical protein